MEHKIIIHLSVGVENLTRQKSTAELHSLYERIKDMFPEDYIILVTPDDGSRKVNMEVFNTDKLEETMHDLKEVLEEFYTFLGSYDGIGKFDL